MKVLLLFLAIVCAVRGAAAGPQDSALTVYYEERAPYQVRVGETIEGLVGTRAAQAFKSANVDVIWEASSISRQLVILRRNMAPSCVVGWFKTAERAQFAKYSKPVYRDGPVVALTRPEFMFKPGPAIRDALTSPGVRVLKRSGYSYGAYLDALLKRTRPALVSSSLPNSQMIELLVARRADLMFTTEEEAAQLLRHLGPRADALQLRHFSDPVPSEPRYIACSGKVPGETMDRIDAALSTE
jgi:polar amino acid transport system substrate-binding protein